MKLSLNHIIVCRNQGEQFLGRNEKGWVDFAEYTLDFVVGSNKEAKSHAVSYIKTTSVLPVSSSNKQDC